MSKKLHVREVKETQVDHSTGEITTSKTTELSMFEKEPPYVKIYLEDIGNLNGLNKSEKTVMYELIRNMGYKNIVPAYKPVKEMMASKLNMPYNTLDKCIKEMSKKGILIRKARGLYVMDPSIFGRGSWSDIKNIRLTVDYNSDGTKTINTELSKQLGIFE